MSDYLRYYHEVYMKIVKNKNNSENNKDALMARLLSGLMEDTQAGKCPHPEEIAALVADKVDKAEKSRLMDHILACSSCYKMFALTAKLEQKAEKKKSYSYRTLALAASVIISVLSIFFVYKTFIETGPSEELFVKLRLDNSFQDFLMKTNKEKISDKKVIDEVVNLLKNQGQKINSESVKEMNIKWPENSSKSIFWKPKEVEVKFENGILTIKILE